MPQVAHRRARAALVAVDAMAAVTAIGGGVALLAGLEGGRFPSDWLAGTPFSSYVIPGWILAIAVGGSATVAAIATLRSRRLGGVASMLAGVIMIGWIGGEIAILTADAELISPTEVLFLAVGMTMIGLGFALSRAELGPQRATDAPGEAARP